MFQATGTTSERVYEALRKRLTQRALRPGDRIDPALLADEFGSSVTPVRDALHILIGQGLVGTGVGEGFYVPHIDEPGLKDLYDWNVDLLQAALRRTATPPLEESPLHEANDVASLTAALFSRVAHRSGSREHALAMRWTNARFAPVRLVESEVLAEVDEEITALADAIDKKDNTAARHLVSNYHKRRKRSAGDIIRSLYRTPTNILPI